MKHLFLLRHLETKVLVLLALFVVFQAFSGEFDNHSAYPTNWYFIDSVNGDDTANGKFPTVSGGDQAWQTINPALIATLPQNAWLWIRSVNSGAGAYTINSAITLPNDSIALIGYDGSDLSIPEWNTNLGEVRIDAQAGCGGIYLDDSNSSALISCLTFEDCDDYGICLEGTGTPITNIRVSNCKFTTPNSTTTPTHSLEISNGYSINVNTSAFEDDSILIDEVESLEFLNNVVDVDADIMEITYSSTCNFQRNFFLGASGATGIDISYSMYINFYDNLIKGSFSNECVEEVTSMSYGEWVNNTLKNEYDGGDGYKGDRNVGCALDFFLNNIVYVTSTSSQGYPISLTSNCLNGTYNSIDCNCYFSSNSAMVGKFNSVNKTTIGSWQTALGGSYEASSIDLDPGFDATTGWKLSTSSPTACIEQGSSIVCSDSDIEWGPRGDASIISRGADQYDLGLYTPSPVLFPFVKRGRVTTMDLIIGQNGMKSFEITGFTNSNTTDFTVTGFPVSGISLGPNMFAYLVIEFHPTSAGAGTKTANISFSNNAEPGSGGVYVLQVSGTTN